jgi:hypothetical protein
MSNLNNISIEDRIINSQIAILSAKTLFQLNELLDNIGKLGLGIFYKGKDSDEPKEVINFIDCDNEGEIFVDFVGGCRALPFYVLKQVLRVDVIEEENVK